MAIDAQQAANPAHWLKLMEACGVTVWNTAPPVMTMLLEYDADPDVADQFGITPLIHAAARGDFLSVKMLLEAGATATKEDVEGKSAVDDLRESKLLNALKLTTEDFMPVTAYQVSERGEELLERPLALSHLSLASCRGSR